MDPLFRLYQVNPWGWVRLDWSRPNPGCILYSMDHLFRLYLVNPWGWVRLDWSRPNPGCILYSMDPSWLEHGSLLLLLASFLPGIVNYIFIYEIFSTNIYYLFSNNWFIERLQDEILSKKNYDLVPQSIIFSLGIWNSNPPHLRRRKCPNAMAILLLNKLD